MPSTVLFEARLRQGTVVLRPHGEVDVATQQAFAATIISNVSRRPVEVDLSRVDFLAISSLGALLTCQLLAERCGHRLVFARATPPVRMLLALSGVDRRLELGEEGPGRPLAPPRTGPPRATA